MLHALQSFWTKPALNKYTSKHETSKPHERYLGGWTAQRQHWCSWVLSCLSASRHYEVHLVTDRKGKEILIDALELPYTQVSLALEDIKDLSADFWAFGKLYAYQAQESPFFSLDSDVFLWQRLPNYLEKAAVFCQDKEYFDGKRGFTWLYEDALRITKNLHRPDYVGKSDAALNAGIFGGNRLDFFQQLWKDSYTFIQQEEILTQEKFPRNLMNIFCEQYFAACLAKVKQIQVATLRSDFETWQHVFQRVSYTHLIAESKKKYGDKVEQKVKTDFPEYYQKIVALENNLIFS